MRNSQPNPAIFKIIILITCFMLVMLYNKAKAADRHPALANKVAVLFKQDAAKKELKVIVKANINTPVQLYFFTVDGKLAKQITVNNKQETIIKDLKKGTYLYECFNNEVNLKSGKLVLQ